MDLIIFSMIVVLSFITYMFHRMWMKRERRLFMFGIGYSVFFDTNPHLERSLDNYLKLLPEKKIEYKKLFGRKYGNTNNNNIV